MFFLIPLLGVFFLSHNSKIFCKKDFSRCTYYLVIEKFRIKTGFIGEKNENIFAKNLCLIIILCFFCPYTIKTLKRLDLLCSNEYFGVEIHILLIFFLNITKTKNVFLLMNKYLILMAVSNRPVRVACRLSWQGWVEVNSRSCVDKLLDKTRVGEPVIFLPSPAPAPAPCFFFQAAPAPCFFF